MTQMLPRIILRVNGHTQTKFAPPPLSSTTNHTGLTIKLPSLTSLRLRLQQQSARDKGKSVSNHWEVSSDEEGDNDEVWDEVIGEGDGEAGKDEWSDDSEGDGVQSGEYVDLRRLVDAEGKECEEQSQEDGPDWQFETGEKRSSMGNFQTCSLSFSDYIIVSTVLTMFMALS